MNKRFKDMGIGALVAAALVCGGFYVTGNHTSSQPERVVAEAQTGYERIDQEIKSERGINLHSTIFTPEKMGDEKKPLVLFSHGFTGSRKGFPGNPDKPWLFEETAQRLAEQGIMSVMVDFPGCRDSEEASAAYTIENMKSDMNTAIQYMKDNYNVDTDNIAMVGHSMGGRMTALQLSPEFKAAALWAPAAAQGLGGLEDFMGGHDAVQALYEEARANGTADFKGWGEPYTNLSLAFFEENEAADPLKSINNYKGNLMIVVGEKDDAISKATTDKAIGAATNVRDLEVLNIENGGHGFANQVNKKDYSSQERVVSRTVDFMTRKLKEKA